MNNRFNQGYVGQRRAPAILFEGLMGKQGGAKGGLKNWKTRFFRVLGGNLEYYDPRNLRNPLGSLSLWNAVLFDLRFTNDDEQEVVVQSAKIMKEKDSVKEKTNALFSPQKQKEKVEKSIKDDGKDDHPHHLHQNSFPTHHYNHNLATAQNNSSNCADCGQELSSSLWSFNFMSKDREKKQNNKNQKTQCAICGHYFCGFCIRESRVGDVGVVQYCNVCASEQNFFLSMSTVKDKMMKLLMQSQADNSLDGRIITTDGNPSGINGTTTTAVSSPKNLNKNNCDFDGNNNENNEQTVQNSQAQKNDGNILAQKELLKQELKNQVVESLKLDHQSQPSITTVDARPHRNGDSVARPISIGTSPARSTGSSGGTTNAGISLQTPSSADGRKDQRYSTSPTHSGSTINNSASMSIGGGVVGGVGGNAGQGNLTLSGSGSNLGTFATAVDRQHGPSISKVRDSSATIPDGSRKSKKDKNDGRIDQNNGEKTPPTAEFFINPLFTISIPNEKTKDQFSLRKGLFTDPNTIEEGDDEHQSGQTTPSVHGGSAAAAAVAATGATASTLQPPKSPTKRQTSPKISPQQPQTTQPSAQLTNHKPVAPPRPTRPGQAQNIPSPKNNNNNNAQNNTNTNPFSNDNNAAGNNQSQINTPSNNVGNEVETKQLVLHKSNQPPPLPNPNSISNHKPGNHQQQLQQQQQQQQLHRRSGYRASISHNKDFSASVYDSIRLKPKHAQQLPTYQFTAPTTTLAKLDQQQRALELGRRDIQQPINLEFNIPGTFRRNCFCIKTPERELWVNCETHHEKLKWLSVLRTVSQEVTKYSTLPPRLLPDGIEPGSILSSYGTVVQGETAVRGVLSSHILREIQYSQDGAFLNDDGDGAYADALTDRILAQRQERLLKEQKEQEKKQRQNNPNIPTYIDDPTIPLPPPTEQNDDGKIYPANYVNKVLDSKSNLRRTSVVVTSNGVAGQLVVGIDEKNTSAGSISSMGSTGGRISGQIGLTDGNNENIDLLNDGGSTIAIEQVDSDGKPLTQLERLQQVDQNLLNAIRDQLVQELKDASLIHPQSNTQHEERLIGLQDELNNKDFLVQQQLAEIQLLKDKVSELDPVQTILLHTPPPTNHDSLRTHVQYHLIHEAQKFKQSQSMAERDISAGFPVHLRNLFPKILPSASIDLKKRVGGGAYGDVYKGLFYGTDVAIKTLKQSTITEKAITESADNKMVNVNLEALQDLCREIAILSTVNHPNVVLYCGVTLSDQMIPFELLKEKEDSYLKLKNQLSLVQTDVDKLMLDHEHHSRQYQQLQNSLGATGTRSSIHHKQSAPGSTDAISILHDLSKQLTNINTALQNKQFEVQSLTQDFILNATQREQQRIKEGAGLCLVTEWCERGSLFDLLYNYSIILDTRQMFEIALDIARGMNYLHNCTPVIVHRDLKSQNILIGVEGKAKIADFGLSLTHNKQKFNESDDASKPKYGVFGTPEWMAPEVMLGKSYNEKVDVYSFGILLTELFSRQMPFTDLLKDTEYHTVAEYVIVCEQMPTVPSWCQQFLFPLVKQCVAMNPANRPSFEYIVRYFDELLSYSDKDLLLMYDLKRIFYMLNDKRIEFQALAAREITNLIQNQKLHIKLDVCSNSYRLSPNTTIQQHIMDIIKTNLQKEEQQKRLDTKQTVNNTSLPDDNSISTSSTTSTTSNAVTRNGFGKDGTKGLSTAEVLLANFIVADDKHNSTYNTKQILTNRDTQLILRTQQREFEEYSEYIEDMSELLTTTSISNLKLQAQISAAKKHLREGGGPAGRHSLSANLNASLLHSRQSISPSGTSQPQQSQSPISLLTGSNIRADREAQERLRGQLLTFFKPHSHMVQNFRQQQQQSLALQQQQQQQQQQQNGSSGSGGGGVNQTIAGLSSFSPHAQAQATTAQWAANSLPIKKHTQFGLIPADVLIYNSHVKCCCHLHVAGGLQSTLYPTQLDQLTKPDPNMLKNYIRHHHYRDTLVNGNNNSRNSIAQQPPAGAYSQHSKQGHKQSVVGPLPSTTNVGGSNNSGSNLSSLSSGPVIDPQLGLLHPMMITDIEHDVGSDGSFLWSDLRQYFVLKQTAHPLYTTSGSNSNPRHVTTLSQYNGLDAAEFVHRYLRSQGSQGSLSQVYSNSLYNYATRYNRPINRNLGTTPAQIPDNDAINIILRIVYLLTNAMVPETSHEHELCYLSWVLSLFEALSGLLHICDDGEYQEYYAVNYNSGDLNQSGNPNDPVPNPLTTSPAHGLYMESCYDVCISCQEHSCIHIPASNTQQPSPGSSSWLKRDVSSNKNSLAPSSSSLTSSSSSSSLLAAPSTPNATPPFSELGATSLTTPYRTDSNFVLPTSGRDKSLSSIVNRNHSNSFAARSGGSIQQEQPNRNSVGGKQQLGTKAPQRNPSQDRLASNFQGQIERVEGRPITYISTRRFISDLIVDEGAFFSALTFFGFVLKDQAVIEERIQSILESRVKILNTQNSDLSSAQIALLQHQQTTLHQLQQFSYQLQQYKAQQQPANVITSAQVQIQQYQEMAETQQHTLAHDMFIKQQYYVLELYDLNAEFDILFNAIQLYKSTQDVAENVLSYLVTILPISLLPTLCYGVPTHIMSKLHAKIKRDMYEMHSLVQKLNLSFLRSGFQEQIYQYCLETESGVNLDHNPNNPYNDMTIGQLQPKYLFHSFFGPRENMEQILQTVYLNKQLHPEVKPHQQIEQMVENLVQQRMVEYQELMEQKSKASLKQQQQQLQQQIQLAQLSPQSTQLQISTQISAPEAQNSNLSHLHVSPSQPNDYDRNSGSSFVTYANSSSNNNNPKSHFSPISPVNLIDNSSNNFDDQQNQQNQQSLVKSISASSFEPSNKQQNRIQQHPNAVSYQQLEPSPLYQSQPQHQHQHQQQTTQTPQNSQPQHNRGSSLTNYSMPAPLRPAPTPTAQPKVSTMQQILNGNSIRGVTSPVRQAPTLPRSPTTGPIVQQQGGQQGYDSQRGGLSPLGGPQQHPQQQQQQQYAQQHYLSQRQQQQQLQQQQQQQQQMYQSQRGPPQTPSRPAPQPGSTQARQQPQQQQQQQNLMTMFQNPK